MFIYIIPLRSYIPPFHLDPIYHHLCLFNPNLNNTHSNLNQFSRIRYRGTAPKKTAQAGPPNLAWKRQMDNGHSSCKPTKAKPSRKRCFATGTSAWTRKLLETPQLSVTNVTYSSLHGLWKKTSWTVQKYISYTGSKKSKVTIFSGEYQYSMYPYKIQNIFCKVLQIFPHVYLHVHVDPSVSVQQPAVFFPDMLNTSPLWRASCQRPAWLRCSPSCSWNITIFAGTWDARTTMQGSVGFYFSTKKIEGNSNCPWEKRNKNNNLQYRWVYGDRVSKGARSLKGFLFWWLVFDPISTPNKSFSNAKKLFCLQTKYLGVKAAHQIPHSCSGCIWPIPGNWSFSWSRVLGTTGLMGTPRSRLETFRVDWAIPSLFKEVTHFHNVYHRLLP